MEEKNARLEELALSMIPLVAALQNTMAQIEIVKHSKTDDSKFACGGIVKSDHKTVTINTGERVLTTAQIVALGGTIPSSWHQNIAADSPMIKMFSDD